LKEIATLVIGAAIPLFSIWLKTYMDRKTLVSNEIFKLRLEALDSVWKVFLKAKETFGIKVAKGHKNWLTSHRDESALELKALRTKIEENQVILPSEVIRRFLDIELYLYNVLMMDDQSATEYMEKLGTLTKSLLTAVNRTLKQQTHEIDLEVRA
jgi:hypothetical protein